jgi:serine/threonine-protein phosphatase 6 regulatory subunit 3
VEAVFNTLLEDEELMALLFSLLESEPPLTCKTAGYFGRVIGHLLIRKTNEMMSYLQSNLAMLDRLIKHVDTMSVADIVKRLVGADEQSSMLFVPSHTLWLSETQLVNMLLQRLGSSHSADVQANTADILCAIAHMQPSALSSKLMQKESIDILFQHALAPGGKVCAALPALAGLARAGCPHAGWQAGCCSRAGRLPLPAPALAPPPLCVLPPRPEGPGA